MREVVVGDVEQETPDVRDVGAAEPAVQAGRLALASHPGGHQVYSINKFTTPHNSVSSSNLKEDAVTASTAATANNTAKSAMLSSDVVSKTNPVIISMSLSEN